MKKFKSVIMFMLVCFMTVISCGDVEVLAKVQHEEDNNPKFSSDGPNDSHQLFAKQALTIIANDKGSDLLDPINSKVKIMLTYCDKPDSDEAQHLFAYHFYNPYTKRNFLLSSSKDSKITGLTKFQEHMKNAVKYYDKNKNKSMEELGRAIHFLEDINVPHHSANLVAVLSTHSQYEKYISDNNDLFYVETSDLYDKYSNYSFEEYCTAIFDDCAKNSYSYKELANSKNRDNWEEAAKPTTQMAQETIASLIYRFLNEVNN